MVWQGDEEPMCGFPCKDKVNSVWVFDNRVPNTCAVPVDEFESQRTPCPHSLNSESLTDTNQELSSKTRYGHLVIPLADYKAIVHNPKHQDNFDIIWEEGASGDKTYMVPHQKHPVNPNTYGRLNLRGIGCLECAHRKLFPLGQEIPETRLHLGPIPNRFQHTDPRCKCGGERVMMIDLHVLVTLDSEGCPKSESKGGTVIEACKLYVDRKYRLPKFPQWRTDT